MTYKMTYDMETGRQAERFLILLDWGALTPEEFRTAEHAAVARGVELERILIREFGVPKQKVLASLSEHYKCPFVEYD